jgi:hypothetical protein
VARWRNYQTTLQPLFDRLTHSLTSVRDKQPIG